MKKCLSFILIALSITILTAIAVYCAISLYNLRQIDYNLQLETNGFVKEDITMLTFQQSRLQNWLVAILFFSSLSVVVLIMWLIIAKLIED